MLGWREEELRHGLTVCSCLRGPDRVLRLLFAGSPTFASLLGKINFTMVAFIQPRSWAHVSPVVVTNVRLFFQHEES